MAQFVKLNENNIVTEIHSISNIELLDENGIETEQKGIQFLTQWSNGYTNWKLISTDSMCITPNAIIGSTYDETTDRFILPKPYPSWILNRDTYYWEPPISIPEDGNEYWWDENNVSWIVYQ